MKRIGQNVFFVFIVSVLTVCGGLFEKFVIVVTSFHRGHFPAYYKTYLVGNYVLDFLLIFALKGIIIGGIIFVLNNILNKNKSLVDVNSLIDNLEY